MMLGSIAAISHAYRETGADFVELISHEDGCDYDELAANVKWKCQLDKLHRRRCQPENCEESIQMRCKCRKSGKCAWKQFTIKCTSKANDAKCQKLTGTAFIILLLLFRRRRLVVMGLRGVSILTGLNVRLNIIALTWRCTFCSLITGWAD